MSEWISVDKKLPDDDESVLMIEEGQECMPVLGWYNDGSDGDIPGFYPSISFFTIRMHVTHWMPIPKLDSDKKTLVIKRNVKDEVIKHSGPINFVA